MLKDLNYFPLDVESNIYGMTTLQFNDSTNKVLVATQDCRIYCINYNPSFKPQTREVEFTYIPNGAKIISIGALKRGPDDFVIGITHSLAPTSTLINTNSSSTSTIINTNSTNSTTGTTSTTTRDIVLDNNYNNNRQTTYYFNIYASESVLPNFDLDYVAQGCQTLRLRYVPYHLYSTEFISATKLSSNDNTAIKITRKPFWLLTGGDNNLHAFFEDKPFQSFQEVPIEECLAELGTKQGLSLWVDVANLERNSPNLPGDTNYNDILFERVIVLGFEDGSVRLYHSIMTRRTCKFELVRMSSFDTYTTIIPCVRLFKINSINRRDSRLRQELAKVKSSIVCDIKLVAQSERQQHLEALNLVVVSSVEPCLLFEDVLKNGLDVKYELADSQRLDSATTAIVGDANADGFNELLIGTHGRELLTYQFNSEDRKYDLKHINILNHPIFSLSILDLTGDSSKDVVILLTNGILVMQSSTIKDSIEICRRRLRAALVALENDVK